MQTIADPILDALEKQVGCYGRLAKLAEIQHVHVQNGHAEGLLEVLEQRASVLAEVGELEKVIGPVKQNWSGYFAGLSAGEKSSAERMLGEKRRLLEQITTSDKNDVLVLQQRQLNLGRQIHQAAAARTVNRTYASAAYGKPAPRMDVQR